ncbi:MAG: hypothetical protein GY778_01365 [bacterium]|nr:hypothetical protein [bacterium]
MNARHLSISSILALTVGVAVPAANASHADLSIAKVELNQAIQERDGGNCVPLVRGREVFVRVYVNISPPGTMVNHVDAELKVSTTAGLRTYAARNAPMILGYKWGTDFLNINHTINFSFVVDEAFAVISVELNPAGPNHVLESDYTNNTWVDTVTFDCKKKWHVGYVPVNYRTRGWPNAALIGPGSGDAFLRGIYPTDDLRYYSLPGINLNQDLDIVANRANFFIALATYWAGQEDHQYRPDHLYAWIPGCLLGNGATPGTNTGALARVSYGNTEDGSVCPSTCSTDGICDRFQRTIAHEIGHHMIGGHTPGTIGDVNTDGGCGDGWYGVDVLNNLGLGRIKDVSLFDIMRGGRHTPEAWISIPEYEALLNHVDLDCGSQPPPPSETENMRVAGIYDVGTGVVELTSIFEIGVDDPVTSPDPGGMLRLVGLDPPNVLYDIPFSPVALACDAENCADDVRPFLLNVPARVGPGGAVPVQRLEIIDVASSSLIAERNRTAVSPTVNFTNVNPGDALLDGQSIQWAGSDPDGGPIEYILSWSWDDGTSYLPLGLSTTTNSHSLRTAEMPGSLQGQGRLRLTASDGFNNTTVEVAGLNLADRKVPTVRVILPPDGARTRDGAWVQLRANVHDLEDGFLDPVAGGPSPIAWSSDLDGPLGTGRSLETGTLSLGTHLICVQATDSDAMTGIDCVTIEVFDRPWPGDFNRDGSVDLEDHTPFVACLAGPDTAPSPLPPITTQDCLDVFDMDRDGDVDLTDFGAMQSAFDVL